MILHYMIDAYLLQKLPSHQLLITSELRSLCKEHLENTEERLSFGVPHFYGKHRIAFIWPTCIPKSGVPEDGVLLGFWRGHLIQHQQSRFRGQQNKVVRFHVYTSVEEVLGDIENIAIWIMEAKELDAISAC